MKMLAVHRHLSADREATAPQGYPHYRLVISCFLKRVHFLSLKAICPKEFSPHNWLISKMIPWVVIPFLPNLYLVGTGGHQYCSGLLPTVGCREVPK